jgi:hypothetical protein
MANTWGQEAFAMPEVVQSVVRCQTNGPLLAVAAQLWIGADDLVVDVTYGRGNFWTHYRPRHLVAHDLRLDGVDFRQLPEADASVDVAVFDPPYITTGPATEGGVGEMHHRYGLDPGNYSQDDLRALIGGGIKECARILKPKGRLLVKCMDFVTSGRLVLGRHFVVSTALAAGLEQVDEFIHASGTGPQPEGRRQVHSRRAHSFLCVFQASRRVQQFDGRPAHGDG